MNQEITILTNRIINLIHVLQTNHNISNINDFKNNENAYEHFQNLFVIKSILESVILITNNDDKIAYFNHIRADINNIILDYEKELLI